MPVKRFCLAFFLFCTSMLHAQKQQPPAIDTSITDYDFMFNELDAFLDSITAPRSFILVNLGFSQNFFTYENGADYTVTTKRKWVLAPSVAYFHKSGFGASVASSILRDAGKFNPYQFTFTASYDLVGRHRFIGGVSYSRYVSKNNLPFYTSPLQNSLYGYFTYRKFWLKPTLAASYGWGNRTEYQERAQYIQSIRLRPRGYTSVNTSESIYDFNLTASVRHDFYWLDVFSEKDFFRITPQISFISGTQKFGFNQNSNTYATVRGTGANVLYNSENVNLDDQLYFQPVSLTAFLKAEYSYGKFYIQPQVMFDYYFPATSNNFSTIFLLNIGAMF